eukprot:Gb_15211 [translate_table: standard]
MQLEEAEKILQRMSNLIEESGPQKKPKQRIENNQRTEKASQGEDIREFFGANRFNTMAQDMEVEEGSVVKETPFLSQLAQKEKKETSPEDVPTQAFHRRGRSRSRSSRKSNPIG